MGKKDKKRKKQEVENNQDKDTMQEVSGDAADQAIENDATDTASAEKISVEKEIESPEQMLESLTEKLKKAESEKEDFRDKNLRLLAEFENFRRRTARERMELVQSATQDLMRELLAVIDDFDRATPSIENSDDLQVIREGYALISGKLVNTLTQNGLKAMESLGTDFDPELHEAITEIPAPSKDQKGKVVDVIEKGYTLNDKIIRYAKVVVGK